MVCTDGIKISVIVPVYKVENYLMRCVDSIINQTHSNLEIILVDDGSPDNCGRICDDYAVKDSRIIVIHKENGGLSDARNAGIEIATGEYLGFVDSDDWIEPHMYEMLLNNMLTNNAQISVGGVEDDFEIKYGEYKVTKTTFDGKETIKTRNREEAIIKFFEGDFSAWDKLYKKELFECVRFPKGKIVEDEAIGLYLLDSCDFVVYTNIVCYHYTLRSGSITNQTYSGEFQHQGFYPALMDWYEHCVNNINYVEMNHPKLLKYAKIREYNAIAYLYQCTMYTNDTDYLEEKRMLKRKFLCRYFKYIFNINIRFKNKIIDTILMVSASVNSPIMYRKTMEILRRVKAGQVR